MRNFFQFIKWTIIVAGTLCVVVVALCTTFFYFMLSPTTSLTKYEDIVGKSKRKEATKDLALRSLEHFPECIPPSAKDAKFFYSPGFRAGMQTQLLLTLPESEVAEIERHLRSEHQPKPADLVNGRPYTFPAAWLKNGWLSMEPSYEARRVSDDFIWFDLSPARDPSPYNRHWLTKGVAVSQSKHQVFYWLGN
ncbi:hypothetical protein ACFQDI_04570 [Prosthecobacter fluviatilis]|uniref:Uncharacterized protein n=2 Tax=Prosthecobacter fluviatilis TaxID=445931 RepID=A0ABW0KLC2_9BACT